MAHHYAPGATSSGLFRRRCCAADRRPTRSALARTAPLMAETCCYECSSLLPSRRRLSCRSEAAERRSPSTPSPCGGSQRAKLAGAAVQSRPPLPRPPCGKGGYWAHPPLPGVGGASPPGLEFFLNRLPPGPCWSHPCRSPWSAHVMSFSVTFVTWPTRSRRRSAPCRTHPSSSVAGKSDTGGNETW